MISHKLGYFLRGIAMLMILFAHSLNEYEAFNSAAAHLLFVRHWGRLGCALFFFMSAYGVSLSMSKHNKLDIKYLFSHILRLFEPFLTAWTLAAAILYMQGEWHAEAALNLLTLTYPNGVDMWFFKIILLNYVLLYTLHRFQSSAKCRLLILLAFHLLFAATLRYEGVPSYWYDVNLAFVLGYSVTVYPKQASRILKPLTSIHVASSLSSALSLTIGWIGKESLAYYLFSIPVMMAIPSDNMHWSLYFLLNLALCTLFACTYRKFFVLLQSKKDLNTKNI